jgi:hypothetical protein
MGQNEDYSDYSRHITTIMNGLTLIEGFIYTAITLLLTRLNQASATYSQILLLLLVILFYLNGLVVNTSAQKHFIIAENSHLAPGEFPFAPD